MYFSKEFTHSELMEHLNNVQSDHDFVSVSYIGQSVFGRAIPMVTLGERGAQKSVLYVATHHASENVCTSVLLKFLNDYISAYERFAQIYQINMRYLFKTRKIYIVPMLNPDGVEYRLRGVGEENPIKERILAYNGGDNFSKWNANGRGVDLNHNYNAYFEKYKAHEEREGIVNGARGYSGEYPESEPETGALANFIRYNAQELEGIITLHSQGEEIYCSSKDIELPKAQHIGRLISRLTGYKLLKAQGNSACGGLTDWVIKELEIPSFTIECGIGENPLPVSQIPSIYAAVRETLFTFPILF